MKFHAAFIWAKEVLPTTPLKHNTNEIDSKISPLFLSKNPDLQGLGIRTSYKSAFLMT